MVYLTVELDTEYRLHLSRAPDFKSWSMFGVSISCGIAAAFLDEVPDYMVWKILYVMTGLFIGISCMDYWEDCDFNKLTGKIRLSRCSVWDMILDLFIDIRDVVIAQIEDVSEVIVQEDLFVWGKGYRIVLQLKTGMSLPITKAFTCGLSIEHEVIAQKIRRFLAQDSTTGGVVSSQDDAYMGDTSSAEEEEEVEDEEDDDFEKIDVAEIMDIINPDEVQ